MTEVPGPPSELVLEAARAIRPYLATLCPGEAVVVDPDLARLLAAAAAGEDVRGPVLDRLRAQPATWQWWLEFARRGAPPDVTAGAHRGYGELAGEGAPVAMPRFVCPRGDYVWYRRAVGHRPPVCPTHRVALEPPQPT
jgi:hypothetical protein